jgi:hypothetical protein
VVDPVEELLQVNVHRDLVTCGHMILGLFQCCMSAVPLWPLLTSPIASLGLVASVVWSPDTIGDLPG